MKKNILLLLIFVIVNGCLKDNPLETPKVEISNTIELLTYLESQGDYINASAPSFIECSEVYNNLNTYLVIDVRNRNKFNLGHIEKAINLSPDSLYNFINMHSGNYEKVIIVSETGHASSYYTCLSRLAGFSNIYSMKFGMAYWHSDFAGKWLQSIEYYDVNRFVQYDSGKNREGNLPELNFSDERKTINEKLLERIRLLLAQGFNEDDIQANSPFESSNLITIEKIYQDFEQPGQDSTYIVCYGPAGLYKASKFDPYPDKGHPEGAVLYEENDFRSINYLQTLPVNRKIAIYDYNGQTAAFLTAYLRVLGYNAKTILYGASHFFHYRLLIMNSPEAFYPELINNFPYIK